MNVSVTRSGGFAGLRRTWVVVIDDQPDTESWRDLLERLPWDNRPRGAREPDRYSYEIRYSHHHATLPEQQLTGPWRELVDRVRNTEADSTAS
ncbi:MAG: hypothetical protein JWQ43_2929 [Glaciihabitans sp.]|nr:hypothetical protein [Glaciihabitans sp.]